jgi:hypothetical protein
MRLVPKLVEDINNAEENKPPLMRYGAAWPKTIMGSLATPATPKTDAEAGATALFNVDAAPLDAFEGCDQTPSLHLKAMSGAVLPASVSRATPVVAIPLEPLATFRAEARLVPGPNRPGIEASEVKVSSP